MESDWGYIEPEKLFFEAGRTRPLSELVDNLIEKWEPQANRFPSATAEQTIEIIPKLEHQEESSTSNLNAAKKILKTKDSIQKHSLNLKRVSFEVERFAANETYDPTERESTKTQIALRLGAKPEKKKCINYKAMKEEKLQKKQKTEYEKLQHAEIYSLKNKKKRKTKNKRNQL
uniref:Uncharacterized protein n=1 Tax=Acrobeloides nanus TaxID=290746 RepID=A0A914D803_9BILA